jgi:molybdopterin-guanine dinucleotide biosynthesis protein A
MAAAAVLAGGASRRMGRDKATLPVAGVALASLTLAAAARVADPVVLVAPDGHPARRVADAGPGRPPVPVVTDPGHGPLAALAAALAALDADHVLVLAADHPGLRPELLAHLVGLAGRGDAVACRRGPRLEPLVAVYRRRPALAAARARLADPAGDRSLLGLLAALDTVVVEEAGWRPLDPDGRSFVDLDDPADLAGWVRARVQPEDATPTEGEAMDELEAFLERVRSLLGPNPPALGPGEVEAILELARVAAHTAERRAAPVTTYLAGLVLAGAAPEAREAFLDDLVVKLEVGR